MLYVALLCLTAVEPFRSLAPSRRDATVKIIWPLGVRTHTVLYYNIFAIIRLTTGAVRPTRLTASSIFEIERSK